MVRAILLATTVAIATAFTGVRIATRTSRFVYLQFVLF